MEKTRRSFLGAAGAAALTGLAGCTGTSLSAKLGLASPESTASWSTINDSVAIKGQPTIEDGVPAAWGTVARTPEEAKDLIDWDALINGHSHESAETSSHLDGFNDIENQFVLIIVGVLPYGRSLTGVHPEKSDMHFEGNVVRNEVTSYRSIVPSESTKNDDEETPKNNDKEAQKNDDEEEPKYMYDYSIMLYNRNGVQTPDTLVVNYNEPK